MGRIKKYPVIRVIPLFIKRRRKALVSRGSLLDTAGASGGRGHPCHFIILDLRRAAAQVAARAWFGHQSSRKYAR